jgi:tRNA CCA-adding enzyme
MEKIKEVLKVELAKISPSEEELEKINLETSGLIAILEKRLKAKKVTAQIFVGGSLAKSTLIKKKEYDVDIFVRFNKSHIKKASEIVSRLLPEAERIHGSRDYFHIRKENIIFEIIPVLKINAPTEAQNVTDLSYFHVSYVKGKIAKNRNLKDEIMLAKAFCHAQNCYGAESYISGFSGYALELLIIHYKSLSNFLKNIDNKDRIIIDPNKFYKKKQQVEQELNESKLQSPIILVDPTYNNRNALAALSKETFQKFQKSALAFLKNPSSKFFEKKDILGELKKKYKNIITLQAQTNKQKGDIAGSKFKKFYLYLKSRISKDHDIKASEFEYLPEINSANYYFVLKEKKNLLVNGPPISSKDHLEAFKKKHKSIIIKEGKAYAKESPKSLQEILKIINQDKTLKEMDIIEVKIIS